MDRIDTLIDAMTLDEKIGQLNLVAAGKAVTGPIATGAVSADIRAGRVGGFLNLWGRDAVEAIQKAAVEETRLGIPLLFGLDVLHGHETVFPIPLAEAGAFDPALWERTARAAAVEAARDGIALTFAPMLDIARDPRWGRIAEGPGEDPLVGALFAEAKVRGFQGTNLAAPGAIAATAKHFCGGGGVTAGLDYAAVDLSERMLHEVYLPPFRAAVDAGCAAVMPAYNSVAGIPMTVHVGLLRDFLRGKLGFDGVIISDYDAVAELPQHGVAADLVEAAALALKAGVDMDMASGTYIAHLPEALAQGFIDRQDIDAAVRRVLMLKQRLGLFENPYRRFEHPEPPAAAPIELARCAARRSITLLTNRGILPLRADLRRIAVIGPLADARSDMMGPWALAGNPKACVTIVDGLKAALPQAEIGFEAGVAINGADTSGIGAACALAGSAEVAILCLGEAADMSGEAASRAMPGLPGRQRELAEAILATGVPVVALISSGRPLTVSWLAEQAQAMVATWFLGNEAGHAIADLLTGRFNPTARLPVTWPREVGQIPIFSAARSPSRPADANRPYTSQYLDLSTEPLFHFGHGLSYSRVRLENLRAKSPNFAVSDLIEIEVTAINEEDRRIEETIFLFIHDLVAKVARPLLELKAWTKIDLAPGQAKTIAFDLPARHLCYLSDTFEPVIEPGAFDIHVGLSADRNALLTIRLHATAAAG